jgi:hypothetical protein
MVKPADVEPAPISPRVMDRDDFWRRVDSFRGDLAPHTAVATDDVDHDVRQLSMAAAAANTPQPVPRHPGFRGAVSRRAKGLIQRLVYWYVEPNLALQREFNAAVLDHCTSMARSVNQLTADNAELRSEVAVLRTHLERLARSRSITRQRARQPQAIDA